MGSGEWGVGPARPTHRGGVAGGALSPLPSPLSPPLPSHKPHPSPSRIESYMSATITKASVQLATVETPYGDGHIEIDPSAAALDTQPRT